MEIELKYAEFGIEEVYPDVPNASEIPKSIKEFSDEYEIKQPLIVSNAGVIIEDLETVENPPDSLYIFHQEIKECEYPVKANSNLPLVKFNYPSSFSESDLASIKKRVDFTGLNIPNLEEIKKIESQMFGNFNELYSLYELFRSKSIQCWQVIKQCENQASASDKLYYSLIKSANLKLSQIQSIGSKIKEMRDQNDTILTNYNKSIKFLKESGLHPALSSEKKKTLMDVYIKETDLQKFKDNCIKSQEQIIVEEDAIDTAINELVKEINLYYQSHKKETYATSDYPNFYKSLEDHINDMAPTVASSVSYSIDHLKTLYLHIAQAKQNILEGIEFLKLTNVLSEYIDEENKQKILLNKSIDSINSNYNCYTSARQFSSRQIHAILKDHAPYFVKIQNVFKYNKRKEMLDQIGKISRDFKFLQKPSLFPEVHDASIQELKKRKAFWNDAIGFINQIENLKKEEINRRDTFLRDYLQEFPSNYFPVLKNLKPNLKIEYSQEEIPILEGEKEEPVKEQSVPKNYELETELRIRESEIKNLKKTIDDRDVSISRLKSELSNMHEQVIIIEKQHEQKSRDYENRIATLEKTSLFMCGKQCVFCKTFDGKIVPDDAKSFSDKITEKDKTIKSLEDDVSKLKKLLLTMSSSCFYLSQDKTKDLNALLSKQKEEFERRMMEYEESLSSEQTKCHLIIQKKTEEFNNELNSKIAHISKMQEEYNTKAENIKKYYTKQINITNEKNAKLATSEKNLKVELELLKKDQVNKDRLKQLADESKVLLASKKQLEDEKNNLLNANKEKQMKIESCEQKIEANKRTIEINAFKLDNKEMELKKLNSQISSKHTECDELIKQMRALESQIQEDKIKYENISNQLKRENQNAINTLQTQYKEESEKLRKEIESLNSKLSEKEGQAVKANVEKLEKTRELDQLNQKIEIGKIKIKELEKIANDLKAQNQTSKDDYEKKIAQFKTNIDLLKEKISNNEFKQKDAVNFDEYSQLKNSYDQANADIEGKNKSIDQLKVSIKQLEEKGNQMEEKYRLLQESHSKATDELKLLQMKVNVLETDNVQLKESKTNTNQLYATQIKEKQEAIDKMNTQLNLKAHEIESLQNNVNQLQDKYAMTNIQCQMKDAELTKCKEDINEMNKRTDQEKLKLVNQISQLTKDFEQTRVELSNTKVATIQKEDFKNYETLPACTMPTATSTLPMQEDMLNYIEIAVGKRVLFICSSPGIYIAFSLNEFSKKDSIKKGKRMIKANLLLDIKSLPKTTQIMLKSFSMYVIARIKSINPIENSSLESTLSKSSEKYYVCIPEKVEHILSFEHDPISITDIVL